MDYFTKALFVRLRSHRDKYLIASDDEESVFQDRSGAKRTARWEVEIVTPPNPSSTRPAYIHLKSAYGRYLSASNTSFLLGMTGRKVVQAAPGPGGRLDSSVDWEPVREGVQVKLKTRNGHFLRANGGPPPWRNSVTHDVPHRTATQDWVLWDVEIVEVRVPSRTSSLAASRELGSGDSFASAASSSPSSNSPSASEAATPRAGFSKQQSTRNRAIFYVVATDNGDTDQPFTTLDFAGTSVEDLTARLLQETGQEHITVCTKNPLNGKLYPLHLRLPPSNAPLRVVVVPSSSKLAKTLPPPLISP